MKSIVVAGGCFWGLEELFRTQPGVVDTEVGYTGGKNENPTYEFHPGHAEALRITYNPDKTTDDDILDYFFRVHDPTTLDQQGNDIGASYRSTIFYDSDEQKETAQKYIDIANKSGLYENPVVTTIDNLDKFYLAEDYHQNYLQKNPGGYTCHFERSNVPLKQ